ncbi:MAG: YbjN domain-containing protein [Clostridia bacterium]|nr:YbjN domain-containing protein [Clostridia bacterium]
MGNKEQAKKVYDSLIRTLDEKNWTYDKFDDDLVIRSGIRGEDLPIEFIISVDAERELVRFFSKLPFNTPEDKRFDVALAVTVANNCLVSGNFDFNIDTGDLYFRLTQSFIGGTVLSDEMFDFVIYVSASTIDEYNDKFFLIAKDKMTLQQFIDENK